MNPYYHHHQTILQQHPVVLGFPVSQLPPPHLLYDQAIPVYFPTHGTGFYYPQPIEYVGEVAILTNPSNTTTMWMNQQHYMTPNMMHPFEAYLEETLMMLDLEMEAEGAMQQQPTTANRNNNSGSGLSEESISQHLNVHAAKGRMVYCEGGEEEEEAEDTCCICLCEYEKNEKMGRLECGHGFHAECIKRWLLSKNVCPMCRSTALTLV